MRPVIDEAGATPGPRLMTVDVFGKTRLPTPEVHSFAW